MDITRNGSSPSVIGPVEYFRGSVLLISAEN
jgi:hypothetical protein